MKYAVMSADNNPDYYNLLPLACYSWSKIGYTPAIIFVNVPHDVVLKIMDACPGAVKTELGPHEGVKDSTIAQVQRLFEWMKMKPDDIMLTADADMVIARDIFTHDVSQGQIVSYGFDLTGRSELPICYVKATATKWRELMGEFTIPDKAYSDKWEDYWSVDQQLLTQRAHEYGMGRITFIDRGNQNKHGLPTGRWDRFDFANIPDSIIDVHMPRNDWDAQIQVFERLWPGEDHSFITKFREVLDNSHAEMKQLSVDSEALDELMTSTKEIVDAYNYPMTLLESKTSASLGHEKIGSKSELIFFEETDTFGFLKTTGNWDNHKPMLLLALSLTEGRVFEYGSGDGSTPYLRVYCKEHGRHFYSLESNKQWAERMGSTHVPDWRATDEWFQCGLAFIDLAPGEDRVYAIERLHDKADIICIHDTEEGGAGDYKFEKIWHLFKYRLNYNKNGGGAGATIVSNTIDVNRFRGLSLGQYTFDND